MQEIESKEEDLLAEVKDDKDDEGDAEDYEVRFGQSNMTLRRCAGYALSCFAFQFPEVTFGLVQPLLEQAM